MILIFGLSLVLDCICLYGSTVPTWTFGDRLIDKDGHRE